MTDEVMSPLRRRMIEDMTIRKLAPKTQQGYIRTDNIARARELLSVRTSQTQSADANAANADEPSALAQPCPCCGGRMSVIERFERGSTPRYRPTPPTTIRIDTS